LAYASGQRRPPAAVPKRAVPSSHHRPVLVVAFLLSGSIAAQLLPAAPAGARVPSTVRPIGDAQFLGVEVGPAAPATPTSTPAGALAPGPRLPIETAEPTPAPPEVVRFRPRDGWTGVSPWAPLSVRFSQPMEHASTQAAFTAAAGNRAVNGSLRWAENDTVLVLQPSSALPYGTTVRLSVAAGAESADGGVLATASSITFAVADPPPRATPAPAPAAKTVRSGWQWPLVGPITQRFGESLTKYGFHQGIDIDGDTGDRVRAARAGKVVVAGSGWDECGGKQVHIDHGNGIVSWYRHLSRIDLAVGSRVEGGTVIGAVGESGCALGSHLHFGISDHGDFVDPLRYLPPR
jgi:murein DD-endopeptidase MepM/ murein hydrolase activator NlpD